jgi:hypothetical protein
MSSSQSKSKRFDPSIVFNEGIKDKYDFSFPK